MKIHVTATNIVNYAPTAVSTCDCRHCAGGGH